MTVQLNLHKKTFIEDMKVLKAIKDAKYPEMVEGLKKHYHLNNVSTNPFSVDNIVINVDLDHFLLIQIFNN